jgi:glycosyltransferase involved in cell wall biosynthesis
MKIAILSTTHAPYRIPLYEAINRAVPEMTLFLMRHHSKESREWDIPHFDFKAEYFSGIHIPLKKSPFPISLNFGVIPRLKRYNPDIVVSGGGYALAHILAFVYCKLFRKKFIGWGELTHEDGAQNSWLKRFVRKTLTKYSDGSIASSSDSKDVFVHYGARPEDVLVSVMPVEVSLFQDGAKAFRGTDAFRQLKAQYPGPTLISIGRLTDSKGLPELFKIYERVIESLPNTYLLIAGNGPERVAYENLVKSKGWDKVIFLGFLQSNELVRYVALSDVFVFPTLVDPFGAVLSEAMAASIPAVSSIHAYATRDLIDEGENGYSIDPENTQDAAEKILKILNMSQAQREKMGSKAQEKASKFNCENAASEMVEYFRKLLQKDTLTSKQ